EVHDGPLDPRGVEKRDLRLLPRVDGQAQAFSFRLGTEPLDNLVEQVGHVGRLERKRDLPGLDPGQLQKLLYELDQAVDLGVGMLEKVVRGSTIADGAGLQRFDNGLDPSEGRTQLVGDVGDEVPPYL